MSLTFISEEGDRSRIEILVDEAHTFTVHCYEGDQPVALDTSATKVEIQKAGSTEDLVAKTNSGVTVGAGEDGSTNNKISYTLSAALNDTKGERFTLTFFAVRNGETAEHERRVLFDVCLTVLYNVVREEDLFELAPALRTERAYLVEGTADSSGGSSSTLIDTALKRWPDDWFNGGVIEFLSGSDLGEVRTVTDFARSSGTVTFSPTISATPDTDSYRLRRSWKSLIDLAYEDVKWRVRDKGNRPALIIDAGELYLPICYHALELCYQAIATFKGESPVDGANWATAREYAEKYDKAFGEIPFQYDSGEDGVPDAELSYGVVRSVRR